MRGGGGGGFGGLDLPLDALHAFRGVSEAGADGAEAGAHAADGEVFLGAVVGGRGCWGVDGGDEV